MVYIKISTATLGRWKDLEQKRLKAEIESRKRKKNKRRLK